MRGSDGFGLLIYTENGLESHKSFLRPSEFAQFDEFERRKFHDLCVKTSYKQVALIARSRGGTSFISYVRQNYAPNFDVLAGIYPVLDWKSYPSFEKLKKDTGYGDEFLNRYNPGKPVN